MAKSSVNRDDSSPTYEEIIAIIDDCSISYLGAILGHVAKRAEWEFFTTPEATIDFVRWAIEGKAEERQS